MSVETDKRRSVAGSDPDAILTVQDVAALLRVPSSWVYDRCRIPAPEGLPHLKLGKYLRFRTAELREWLAQQRDKGNGLNRS